MAAVAKQTESQPDDKFIGRVLRRASPVLTWRPALEARAERERVAAANPEEVSAMLMSDGESVVRLSRAPTRKMIPWPLVSSVRRETPGDERRRAIARGGLAMGAIVLLFGCIALGAAAWESRGVARSEAPATRVLAAHVLDEKVDTLAALASPTPAAAPTPSTLAPTLAATAPARAKAPPPANHRGRAHHGHRATASSTTHR